MARPVLRCQACRFSVLDVFTSLAGISLPARRPSPVSRIRARPPTSRSLYTSSRRLQNTETQRPLENDQPSRPTDAASPGENEPLPWYLAINDPLPPLPTAPSPLLARQEVPSLPPSPPPILDPVLNHLSVAIGLENLTLLDLRSLYPPPALGANLLMIIGTARSVKHLNVSADRFCRWLRSTYKLRPYADGLLGRNELKIKLRRKARRLNLARAAGRLEADEAGRDDGMTTGWVCVNVGPVDDVVVPDAAPGSGASPPSARSESLAEQEQEDDDDADEYADEEDEYQNPDVSSDAAADTDLDDGYTGFGSRTTSQRIVVQMFTEEKRAEMNLEDLYANRNTRMQKRAVKADEGIAAREAREADLARAKAEKEAMRTRRKREQEQEQEQQMMEKAEQAEQEARTAQAAGVPDEGERAEREKQDQANPGSKARQQDADWAPFFKDIK